MQGDGDTDFQISASRVDSRPDGGIDQREAGFTEKGA
jgi:hypothetical protein